MSFGWSAGDVLAAITFVITTCKALHENTGAAEDFRHVTTSLRSIETVLRPLLNLCAFYPEYEKRIQAQVDAVMDPVAKFLESVQPLARSLGIQRTGLLRHFGGIPQKLEWQWFKSKEAISLQEDIRQGGQLINMLLLNINTEEMHKMRDRIPTEMQIACQDAINRTSLEPDIKALTNLIIDIKNMLEGVKGSLDEPTIRPQIFLSGNNYGSATTAKTLYHYTPAMLKSNAFHLEFRDQTCRLGGICNEVHSIEADPGLIFQLDQWWNSSHSDAFWIQESPDAETPSTLATELVALAHTAGFPVVACFCDRRFDIHLSELTQIELIIRLVYAFVYQLVHSFKVDFSSVLDFSKERFSRLNRDPSTILVALKLAEDLISVKSSRLLLVIDGIQVFDDVSEEPVRSLLSDFFRILQTPSQEHSNQKPAVLKTLFTTSGQNLLLENQLKSENIMEIFGGRGAGAYLLGSEMKLAENSLK